MEMNVRDDQKLVEIWLTNAEKIDPVLREGPSRRLVSPSFALENTVVPSVVFTSTWTFKLFR